MFFSQHCQSCDSVLHLLGYNIMWRCHCHNTVSYVYPDIVYITLSFDSPATNTGVHGFMSWQLQVTCSQSCDNVVSFVGSCMFSGINYWSRHKTTKSLFILTSIYFTWWGFQVFKTIFISKGPIIRCLGWVYGAF